MKTQNNLFPVKRIAIVAPPDKRKEVIEWSYFNKAMLASHNLIATHSTADLLEGTVNQPVYKLPVEHEGGYDELSALMLEKKVEFIFFFENPMKSFRPDDSVRKLLDIALEMNIVIATYQSKLDFMPICA